jgi:hypothetical protein
VSELAADHEAPYVRFDQLGLDLSDRDFADFTHMNREGGRRLTRALIERAILPALREMEREE